MNPLFQFLEKIKAKIDTGQANRELIAGGISHALGIIIPSENIEIRGGVVRIKANPTIKSEIFLKKASILEDINSKMSGPARVLDIR